MEIFPEEAFIAALIWSCVVCQAICMTATDNPPKRHCACGGVTWRLEKVDA